MKKVKIFSLVFAILLILVACKDLDKNNTISNVKEGNFEYEQKDLDAFFAEKNGNEWGIISTFDTIAYTKVNNHFKTNIIRAEEQYSIYQVKSGGNYYVFWSVPTTNENILQVDPFVYFTAYISSSKEASLFASIKPNISTARDVKEIDPYFELTFARSSGIYSYSYLDKENLLEIEYFYNPEIDEYEDLVVKSITLIPRENAPACYGTILEKDLPND